MPKQITAAIRVRFARPADLEFVQQDHPDLTEAIRRKIRWHEVLVAECGGLPAGYLRFEYLWSWMPYIAMVRVSPEFRGRGISRALVTFLEALLVEKGRDMLYSSSVAGEAQPQAWHRHVGFEECGFIAGVNGEGVGEVFFRKRIVVR